LLVGLGVGLALGKGALGNAKSHGGKKGAKNKSRPATEVGTVYSLGEMVVNLADTGSLRYAKVSIALGFQEKVSEDKLKEREAVLRDAAISVITGKRFNDLHGKSGMQKLREQIRLATSGRLPGATVVEVYFESFAMQ
jgi:flagellar basal body-associated protein FliL